MNKIIVVRNVDEQVHNELVGMVGTIIQNGQDIFVPYEYINDEFFVSNFEFDVIPY